MTAETATKVVLNQTLFTEVTARTETTSPKELERALFIYVQEQEIARGIAPEEGWTGRVEEIKAGYLANGGTEDIWNLTIAKMHADIQFNAECLARKHNTTGIFAVHPRDLNSSFPDLISTVDFHELSKAWADIHLRFPALRPDQIPWQDIALLYGLLPPVQAGTIGTSEEKHVSITAAPMTLGDITAFHDPQERQKFVLDNMRQVLEQAESRKTKVMGLGMTLGGILNHGELLQEQTESVKITTGHAGTVLLIIEAHKEIRRRSNLDNSAKTVVVGACGSIGRASIELLLEEGYTSIALHDIPKKQESLQKLREDILLRFPDADISIHTGPEGLVDAIDTSLLLISATDSTRPVVTADIAGNRAIGCVDDGQPPNIAEEVSQTSAVLWAVGGPIDGITRDGIDYGIQDNEFGCARETLALSMYYEQFGEAGHEEVNILVDQYLTGEQLRSSGNRFMDIPTTGKITALKAKIMKKIFELVGLPITIKAFSYGEYVDDSRFDALRERAEEMKATKSA